MRMEDFFFSHEYFASLIYKAVGYVKPKEDLKKLEKQGENAVTKFLSLP